MNLILPAHVAAQRRPYAAAPTEALLAELKHRQEIVELQVRSYMPERLPPETVESIRQASFATMFQQLGEALISSPLPYTGTGYEPPLTAEVLIIKLLVVKHPLRPQPVTELALIPPEGA